MQINKLLKNTPFAILDYYGLYVIYYKKARLEMKILNGEVMEDMVNDIYCMSRDLNLISNIAKHLSKGGKK